MMTVYRNRVVSEPANHHHLVFFKDFGASSVYDQFPNTRVDIVKKERLAPYVELAALEQHYAEIRITSLPELSNLLKNRGSSRLVYEFHSSDETVLRKELDVLALSNIDEIRVPSQYLAEVVKSLVPQDFAFLVQVEKNLVDLTVFSAEGTTGTWNMKSGIRPLIWVGRFDKGKNCRDFVRALSLLTPEFVGVVVVSMEDSPDRMAGFLADAAAYGVSHRLEVMMNLAPADVASLYRYARDRSGYFVSTSLGESFGYGVAESMATGLPAIAYSVGAIEERLSDWGSLELVPVGDIEELANRISASPMM
ncbi:glycosyltransferase [Pseudarthrobacter sp. PS3-L1]|uniref:glycosyltransferase family 4 protein n=1 Tax=Pseudarthrobacter sp. PS3-L1 TaxID=3046207 RepID=UPI0024BB2A53|nr:glycosyltransferase [Pseudarthrobacter sp. PS3-L1]MDJ0321724.1 glycosyltransferase [Pseudarthrobacter sp. PS3-L1]